MLSIKTKLALILVFIALVPLASMGGIIFFQTTDSVTKSIQESLLTIVKSKENALENYIDSTEAIGQAIAETSAMQDWIRLSTKGELSSSEELRRRFQERQVQNIIFRFQETNWGKYHHIFLIDESRKIVISPNHGVISAGSPSNHVGQDASENQWAMAALDQGITQVSDYSSWRESDHTHQMLFFPVKDKADNSRAVLGFEKQIPYIREILEEDFQLGETGKLFLMTLDGVEIVYRGIENQQPKITEGFQEALQTGFSSERRVNADGVEVIDLYLRNERYPWVLVAEIEAEEAFRDLLELQKLMLIGIGATLLLAIIVSVFFANTIVKPVRTLTEQMEQISLGNFDIELSETKRNDEIGKLVQAFQRIVVSLRIAMKQIKDKQGG